MITTPRPQLPVIELPPHRVICATHGEPFRARWPIGYAIFVLRAFEKVVTQEDFVKETDREEVRIIPALDRKPLCCWLSPLSLLQVYQSVQEDASPWNTGICDNCGQRMIGVPLRTVSGQKFDHVCLDCFARRMRLE